MRKLLALLMVVVMVFGLVACGGDSAAKAPEAPESTNAPAASNAPAADATEEKEPVTVTMWLLGGFGVDDHYAEQLPERIKAIYPWINLEVELLPGDTGPEKFTIALATNETPDIYFDNYGRIAPAVDAGLTVDLTDVFEANKDIFFSTPAEGNVDGKVHYIPTEAGGAYCMLVNMTLAEELGVADMLPEDDLTWSYEDFLNICRAAKAADPTCYPTALFAGSRSSDMWDYSWFLGNGAKLLNDDHTAMAVNDPGNREKIIEVLEVYQTLVNEQLVTDGAATLTDGDVLSLFASGRMLFESCAAIDNLASTYLQQQEGTCMPFDMRLIAMPTKDGEKPAAASSWGGSGYCAFSNNGHEEEAKLVIDAILKDSAFRTEIINTKSSTPATNDVVLEYPTEEITEIMARFNAYSAEYSVSSFGVLEPFFSDLRETFFPQKQDLYVGNITPEQFVENWAAAGNAVVEKYWANNG